MSRKIDEVKDLSISDRSIASYGNQRFFVDGLDAPVSLIDLLREIIRRLNLTISSNGSETVVNAGANVTVTGSGTTADPYVIASLGGPVDGSETVLNAGANVTVTGSGTAADPYVIASSSGTVPVRDSLSSGIVTAELDRVGGSPCVLTNPNPGEYALTVPAGASISNITVFGNNTALDALNEFTFRVDNSANTLDRRFLVQIHSGNDGSLIDQQALGCIHYQTVAGNITSLKFLIMNGFGTPGFLIELR